MAAARKKQTFWSETISKVDLQRAAVVPQGTAITDAAVDTILKYKKLTKLNVGGTQLSDESFRKLGSLPSLKSLNVANTSIGYDVIDELNEKRKDLEVVEYEN